VSAVYLTFMNHPTAFPGLFMFCLLAAAGSAAPDGDNQIKGQLAGVPISYSVSLDTASGSRGNLILTLRNEGAKSWYVKATDAPWNTEENGRFTFSSDLPRKAEPSDWREGVFSAGDVMLSVIKCEEIKAGEEIRRIIPLTSWFGIFGVNQKSRVYINWNIKLRFWPEDPDPRLVGGRTVFPDPSVAVDVPRIGGFFVLEKAQEASR